MSAAQPLMGFGQVRHTRLRPTRHAFVYPTCFLLLPMRSLAQAARPSAAGDTEVIKNDSYKSISAGGTVPFRLNTKAGISFFDCDHGDGRGPERGGALAWLDELLLREGIADATGEVWLHCYPRVLGFAFKPVSFWYCHGPAVEDGTAPPLRAIVVEVNNTFGERHCYLLENPRYGHEAVADKVFHVSPFCRVEGRYRFRFMRAHHAGQHCTVARIEHDDANGQLLLQTSVSGQLQPLTAQTLRRALWRYPAMTLAVVARIHWQALRLWAKRVRFFSKPVPPETFVTR
jgi:DUF1365 family protein